jgi:uncharacterized membrane protein
MQLNRKKMKDKLNKFLDWLFKPNVLATIKSITYKIISGSTSFFIFFIWTDGNLKHSGQATAIMMTIHFLQYWIHERLWLIWENRRRNADQEDSNG